MLEARIIHEIASEEQAFGRPLQPPADPAKAEMASTLRKLMRTIVPALTYFLGVAV